MCGVAIKFGRFVSLFPVAGSISKTSSAALSKFPSFSALYNASSSITPPREVLTICAVFFISLSFSAFIICFVLSSSGT